MGTWRRVQVASFAVLWALIAAAAAAQPPATSAEPAVYRAVFTGILFGAQKPALLQTAAVQQELHLTESQKQRQTQIVQRFEEKLAAAREQRDQKAYRAAWQAARQELEAGLTENLEPSQQTRLDQIQLQAQGASAFLLDDLPERLHLADEQLTKVRAIAKEGREAAIGATLVALPADAKGLATLESVRQFVKSQEFRAAKVKATAAVLERWQAAVQEIEKQLNDEQRADYLKLLGAPFELEKLLGDDEEDSNVARVAAGLGLTGQRADPDFDVSVAHPAYSERHPSALFDEAHHNFHTAGGRYKAFADLIANDGYRVTPNRRAFSKDVLAGHDVLIIANATAERAPGDGAKSAFTASECDAVQAWVESGGSLLLITDHEPFGSASQELASRFGVEMSAKVANDPANSTKDGLLFSRDKALIADHPITNGRDESERVNRVLTFTGQCLKGPPGSVAFLKLADTAIQFDRETQTSAAGWSQGIAFGFGKGRVVVFGEAGQLSAQVYGLPPHAMGMNVPGCDNRQMALNVMHWLTRLIN
ncbi:MAG TPA: hypothetical protein VMV10_21345 [Pirellulales bacterium]|nr:hypothetical protein [Pirellulales bacterium]